jgi:hypothetical protein
MSQPPSPKSTTLRSSDNVKPQAEQDLKKLKQDQLSNFKDYSGINNQRSIEIKTSFNQAEAEAVYEAGTNAFIVIGKDRNAGIGSGYGGRSFGGCAAIDIVAGHMGARPLEDINGVKVFGEKSFQGDSARIYISQMADIDKYFGIPTYKVKISSVKTILEDSTAKSAVAAKADCIRVVARENIKLVTEHFATNSKTLDADVGGIDIIAGFNIPDKAHDIQPMVKGDNLIQCLVEIVNSMERVQATLTTFMEKQLEINRKFLEHKHQVNPGIKITDVPYNLGNVQKSITEILTKQFGSILSNNYKFQSIGTYFNPESETYINSRYNRVN